VRFSPVDEQTNEGKPTYVTYVEQRSSEKIRPRPRV